MVGAYAFDLEQTEARSVIRGVAGAIRNLPRLRLAGGNL
jgi:hypothetical protein